MAPAEPPAPERTGAPREPLSRQRILNEAVAMADELGLAKLSMRKLAAQLGFEVMSLYNHVANKDDLHAGMVDLIVAEVPLSEPASDWKPALRQHAIATKDMLFRHPWAVPIWVATVPGPERFDRMEWELATLAAAGLGDDAAHRAYHAITNHVVGYSLQASLMNLDQLVPVATELTDTLDADRYPEVLRHVKQHLDGDHALSFEFVLDLILDGISASS